MDPYTQRGDYDSDDDGLIEITTLDRLNAVRWDLDGDAVKDTTSDADWEKRGAAFFNAKASLGCPDTAADADSDPEPLRGLQARRQPRLRRRRGRRFQRPVSQLDAHMRLDERLRRRLRLQQLQHIQPDDSANRQLRRRRAVQARLVDRRHKRRGAAERERNVVRERNVSLYIGALSAILAGRFARVIPPGRYRRPKPGISASSAA